MPDSLTTSDDLTEELRLQAAHHRATGREDDDATAAVLEQAADEIEHLRTVIDPELSFRDLEVKMRDGTVSLTGIGAAEGGEPAIRFLAALMLHVVLGEGDQAAEEPPNYRSAEMSFKPAGAVEGIRASIEVIKPGGKASHAIREDLEAEIEAFRQAVRDGVGPSCEDVCRRSCIGVCGASSIEEVTTGG